MIWQAWAIQGSVLAVAGLALLAGARDWGSFTFRVASPTGQAVGLVCAATAALSFIVAGWVAPWGPS